MSSSQSEERTMFFTRAKNDTSNQNRERWCFFTSDKNDTSNQKSQRCVSFAPKFPPFIGACSLQRPRFSKHLKLYILNRYLVGRGSAWGCLTETRFSWSSVSPYSAFSAHGQTFDVNTQWAFTLFEHWWRLFLGEKSGSIMCCKNWGTSASTDAMTITNSTSQAQIDSRTVATISGIHWFILLDGQL